MTDRLSAILYIVLTALMTAISAVYVLVLSTKPIAQTAPLIAIPALAALSMWFFIWLVVRIGYSREQALAPAFKVYFGRCLVVFASWITLVFAYFFLYLPLSGDTLMSEENYNRFMLLASGLMLFGLGNIVPKLPYQRYCRLLEIGPERTYRVNRIGGWMMVIIGAVQIVCGLSFAPNNAQFYAISVGGLVLLLGPYFWLYYRNVRAFRQENPAA